MITPLVAGLSLEQESKVATIEGFAWPIAVLGEAAYLGGLGRLIAVAPNGSTTVVLTEKVGRRIFDVSEHGIVAQDDGSLVVLSPHGKVQRSLRSLEATEVLAARWVEDDVVAFLLRRRELTVVHFPGSREAVEISRIADQLSLSLGKPAVHGDRVAWGEQLLFEPKLVDGVLTNFQKTVRVWSPGMDRPSTRDIDGESSLVAMDSQGPWLLHEDRSASSSHLHRGVGSSQRISLEGGVREVSVHGGHLLATMGSMVWRSAPGPEGRLDRIAELGPGQVLPPLGSEERLFFSVLRPDRDDSRKDVVEGQWAGWNGGRS